MEKLLVNRKYRILAIELEPTPYKVDLWNAFADSGLFDVYVLYITERNWAPDAGHNFQELPPKNFRSVTLRGQGVSSIIKFASRFYSLYFSWRPEILYISGYVHIQTLIAIFTCITLGNKYAVHSDIFNNSKANSAKERIKYFVRDVIRKLIFRTASALLVCGKLGRDSALVAGCDPSKIYDFPYVVDRRRLLRDEPSEIPLDCISDKKSGNQIILFSGRLIRRKGLETLIDAVYTLRNMSAWSLWIEGDGPELKKYTTKVKSLGLEERCRFLGFSQMSFHSWLLRNSDIVVVPSFQDGWGIVVDEAMQMGKAVVTSDRTGSGADRVVNGTNGMVFAAGNHLQLSVLLQSLLVNPEKRMALGDSAQSTAAKFGPKVNAETISRILWLG